MINSLLKDEVTQEDPQRGSNKDLTLSLKRYGNNLIRDCYQLLGQLLFNSELKDVDDRLKSFSVINDEIGGGYYLLTILFLIHQQVVVIK